MIFFPLVILESLIKTPLASCGREAKLRQAYFTRNRRCVGTKDGRLLGGNQRRENRSKAFKTTKHLRVSVHIRIGRLEHGIQYNRSITHRMNPFPKNHGEKKRELRTPPAVNNVFLPSLEAFAA